MEVIPAILSDIPSEVAELLEQAEKTGKAQIDIIDGVFADNRTVDPSVLNTIMTSATIDFHLMVSEPISWVERCFRAGGDRIIGHIELMGDQLRFIEKVQSLEAKAGLAVDLSTSLDDLEPDALAVVDVILVMSVSAGFGGQDFNQVALPKIKELAQMRETNEGNFDICVDGGVNKYNIAAIASAGADEVAVGSSIFDGDVLTNVQSLKHAATGQK